MRTGKLTAGEVEADPEPGSDRVGRMERSVMSLIGIAGPAGRFLFAAGCMRHSLYLTE